jgi:hypothetical protein
MRTYWLVEIVCGKDGTISARLSDSIQAEERPENEKVSISEMDIYGTGLTAVGKPISL